MATYTIEFGALIDAGYDVGLNDYPIFDESYREHLNTLIIGRYRFREIGAETAALFKHYFYQTLLEIMPYYNDLYKSAQMQFDPLQDVNYTEISSGSSSGTSSSNSTTTDSSTTHNATAGSDTPQNAFNFSNVENNRYLTEAEVSDGSASGSGSANSSGTTSGSSSGTRTVSGKTGGKSYAQMIEEYRRILLNIDRRILDDLNDCFMNIW